MSEKRNPGLGGYLRRTPCSQTQGALSSFPLRHSRSQAAGEHSRPRTRPTQPSTVAHAETLGPGRRRSVGLDPWEGRQNSADRCQDEAAEGGRVPLSSSSASSPHGVVRKPARDGKRCNATLPPVRRPSLLLASRQRCSVGALCRRFVLLSLLPLHRSTSIHAATRVSHPCVCARAFPAHLH